MIELWIIYFLSVNRNFLLVLSIYLFIKRKKKLGEKGIMVIDQKESSCRTNLVAYRAEPSNRKFI